MARKPADELRVFPHELRPGDRVTVNGVEWEVAAPPAVYLQGKMHTIRLQQAWRPERDRRRAHARARAGGSAAGMTPDGPSLANRRGSLLLTALRWRVCRGRVATPEIAGAIEAWLSGWRGLGLVVDGMGRRGYDIELIVFDGQQWRSTFYTAGLAHSLTSWTGTASAETPWRAVQLSAWDALCKAEPA